MIFAELERLAYLVAYGVLLATAVGLWLRLRSHVLRLERLLAETRIELKGANNRLAQARDQAALLSNTDPVTGLMSHHVMVERFHLTLTQAKRNKACFGIILVKLTNFDRLCVSLSLEVANQVGNQLLIAAATRLIATTRETDTVSRVGEQEFAVLLPNLRGPADIDAVVLKLHAAFNAHFTLHGTMQAFSVAVAFGSACYPQDGDDWISVMKAASYSQLLGQTHSQSLFDCLG